MDRVPKVLNDQACEEEMINRFGVFLTKATPKRSMLGSFDKIVSHGRLFFQNCPHE